MTDKQNRGMKLILLIIFGLTFLLPFLVMVSGAFINVKTPVGNPFTWLQRYGVSSANFEYIFKFSKFGTWIKNSLIISVIPTALQMFFAAILGYIFARKEFKFKNFIFWMMMSVVMIPTQVLIIPRYLMFSKLGMIDTLTVLILPVIYGIMGVFLVRQFVQQIPSSYEESARIDGASDFKIFGYIILPLCGPVIATVGTFAFVGAWNDFMTPLIFTTSSELYPVTVGLSTLLTQDAHFGIQMAGSLVSFLPTFLIFLFFQKYFTKGVAFTGIK